MVEITVLKFELMHDLALETQLAWQGKHIAMGIKDRVCEYKRENN